MVDKVVDKVVDKSGTRAVAQVCVEYLCCPQGQDIAGRHHCRPTAPAAAARFARPLPRRMLFRVDAVFDAWAKAQKAHFADGGSFDWVHLKK